MLIINKLKERGVVWFLNRLKVLFFESAKSKALIFLKQVKSKRRYTCREEYIVDINELDKSRKLGLSGFMRLHNEERYLGKVIESYIDILDELIIVYNNCTDRTEEISLFYKEKYPEKIKLYEYKPRVYGPGTIEHASTHPLDEQSLVNYYNFALSKTTLSHAMKVDGDCIVIKERLLDIKRKALLPENDNRYHYFYGVNLKWSKDNELAINKPTPLTAGFDHGVFKVSSKTYFTHSYNYELFKHNLIDSDNGIVYYHLKFLKPDDAKNSHGLDTKQYQDYYQERLQRDVILWDDFSLVKDVPFPLSIKDF